MPNNPAILSLIGGPAELIVVEPDCAYFFDLLVFSATLPQLSESFEHTARIMTLVTLLDLLLGGVYEEVPVVQRGISTYSLGFD